MSEELGPHVRLWGITTAQLPTPTESADGLTPFLMALLQEALPFIDTAAPKAADFSDPALPAPRASNALWKAKGTKTLPGSDAPVELSERVVPAKELEAVAPPAPAPPAEEQEQAKKAKAKAAAKAAAKKITAETWACRRSVHRDAAARGTASWAEFADCIRDRHAETEDAFTPAVLGHREALSWDSARGVAPIEEGGVAWGSFTLKLIEMKHKIPPPLSRRVFPVLQMTCAAQTEQSHGPDAPGSSRVKDEFLVVSTTVTDFAGNEKAVFSKEKGVVVGWYASIERVRKLPTGDIEWVMATASDAKGMLPLWVQTMAVTGLVAKDVSMFLTWLAKERDGNGQKASNGKGVEKGAGPKTTAPQNGDLALQQDKQDDGIGTVPGPEHAAQVNGQQVVAT